MSVFLLLVLFQPLIVAGVLTLAVAADLCWLVPWVLLGGLQSAGWACVGCALLLPVVVCGLIARFLFSLLRKKPGKWGGGGANEL